MVTVTGPRQSGKTTLCRAAFPRKPYVSLEPPDQRDLARHDPRAFLARYPRGVIIDEVQRAPEILSYVQEVVDRATGSGQYILTGSQQPGLLEAVAQTLAGRTALLQLLPLNLSEIRRFPKRQPISGRSSGPAGIHASTTSDCLPMSGCRDQIGADRGAGRLHRIVAGRGRPSSRAGRQGRGRAQGHLRGNRLTRPHGRAPALVAGHRPRRVDRRAHAKTAPPAVAVKRHCSGERAGRCQSTASNNSCSHGARSCLFETSGDDR